jgi:hypothetical protein
VDENRIILPPTQGVIEIVDTLDNLIGRFLKAGIGIERGKYEADTESVNMMWLVIRHIEGVGSLAKEDLVLLPAALSMARPAFELGVKINWMLQPEDPFEREARWLSQLRNGEEYNKKTSSILQKFNIENQGFRNQAKTIKEFRENITRLLPSKYKAVQKMPSLRDMLVALKDERRYLLYIYLSQFTHGSHVATDTYRRNLGTMQEFGEYIEPRDWRVPFTACWYTMATAATLVIDRLGGDISNYITQEITDEMSKKLSRLD